MKICFLLTHVPNPRINKRIEVLKNHFDIKVVCVRRKSQNIWEPEQDVEHVIFDMDMPSSKQILKRYVYSKKYKKLAIEKLKEWSPDIIYTEGLDSLNIAYDYTKHNHCRIAYEVADVREKYLTKPKNVIDSIVNKLLTLNEKRNFQHVDLLVITSQLFYDKYYRQFIDKEKVLFMPNIPNIEVFDGFVSKNAGPFTIGFIGGIRYLKQMKMLVDCSNAIGCNVLFAGAGGSTVEFEEIKSYCNGLSNVAFTGRYNYSSEIAGLYGKVDCVFAVYDANNPNVKIALPNKLYESIICELPIIVSKGTYLSELVNEWGVGVSVSHEDPSELKRALEGLRNPDFCSKIKEKCKVERQKLIASSFNNELLNRVQVIIKDAE